MDCPLTVLVTYRDTDVGTDDPLAAVLADLRRLEGVERISLHGLAVEDVEAMTAAVAGHDLDEEGVALAGEIAAETDGNPFFVGEILRNLAESGLVVFDEGRGRWQVDRSSGVACRRACGRSSSGAWRCSARARDRPSRSRR